MFTLFILKFHLKYKTNYTETMADCKVNFLAVIFFGYWVRTVVPKLFRCADLNRIFWWPAKCKILRRDSRNTSANLEDHQRSAEQTLGITGLESHEFSNRYATFFESEEVYLIHFLLRNWEYCLTFQWLPILFTPLVVKQFCKLGNVIHNITVCHWPVITWKNVGIIEQR